MQLYICRIDHRERCILFILSLHRCILRQCRLSDADRVNDAAHSAHSKRTIRWCRSFVWINKREAFENRSSHISHWYFFSRCLLFIWSTRFRFDVHILLQNRQIMSNWCWDLRWCRKLRRTIDLLQISHSFIMIEIDKRWVVFASLSPPNILPHFEQI